MGKPCVYRCYRSVEDSRLTATTSLWSHQRKRATKSALFKLVMHDILVSFFGFIGHVYDCRNRYCVSYVSSNNICKTNTTENVKRVVYSIEMLLFLHKC